MTMPQSACYHRAIIVATDDLGRVVTEMEDDFHHFRVALAHQRGVIASIAAEAVRHPWTLCPAAAASLQAFVGGTLTMSLVDALRRLPIREHCTHLYDLTCLAIVYAAKAISKRRWDMTVDLPSDGERGARVLIDGVPTLAWTIVGSDVVRPFTASLKGDFAHNVTARLAPEGAETALLLRRAIFVSGGRRGDLDLRATAADGARNLGGCFVMQPGVAEHAARVKGATLTFGAGALPLASA